MAVFKTIGLITVFSVCSLCGISFSAELKKRAKSFEEICYSVSVLKNEINHSGKELGEILPYAFKNCDFIEFKGASATVKKSILKKCDEEKLNEFFSVLGTDEKYGETEKISLYLEDFEQKKEKALNEAQSKCRIFTVSGICAGIAAVILFL